MLLFKKPNQFFLNKQTTYEVMMKKVKIVIERHEDGYVGYPLGFTHGAIVGQGDTYEKALKDTESAIRFFIRHYGKKKFFGHLEADSPTLEA